MLEAISNFLQSRLEKLQGKGLYYAAYILAGALGKIFWNWYKGSAARARIRGKQR